MRSRKDGNLLLLKISATENFLNNCFNFLIADQPLTFDSFLLFFPQVSYLTASSFNHYLS